MSKRHFESGHGSDKRTILEWVESEPLVKSWFAQIRPSTREYAMSLREYWFRSSEQEIQEP